ncbi:ABC transporter permease [Paenibacillus koleovorans]|uniref:ABC transporter permease n=1 Tax=Paenibacillus koleovorans TaxID=121608 RepID=UPI000FD7DE8D|nr:ABC transporter permease subunit [Paenibacillus koleovorans]
MRTKHESATGRVFLPQSRMSRVIRALVRDRYLLLLISPVLLYYVIFHYVPMYGVTIAFKNFRPVDGILGSDWVGFKHFEQFFQSLYFGRLLRNTLLISLYSLFWGFPVPIAFALLLNELKDRVFKRAVQTISYLPHFISIVVVAGMIIAFTHPIDGVVNILLVKLGLQPISFITEPGWFRTLFVSSGIWQQFGWGSIIYLAAIAGINPQLYEAAEMDGAKRRHKMLYITLPGILPTVIILFILNVGNLMDVGFEKVLLLYSPMTYETADVIGTFVYRRGIVSADFSFAAAVNLFNNVINIILLITVNRISRRLTDTSLW